MIQGVLCRFMPHNVMQFAVILGRSWGQPSFKSIGFEGRSLLRQINDLTGNGSKRDC